MNRQDIRLIADARAGNVSAKCEAGRRYLTGTSGFPRHIRLGLEYLTHASVQALPASNELIADHLSLQELIVHQQRSALEAAASSGRSTAALEKLGDLAAIYGGRYDGGLAVLQDAAGRGDQVAARALAARGGDGSLLARYLQERKRAGVTDGYSALLLVAKDLLAQDDLLSLIRCVSAAMHLSEAPSAELADLVLKVVELAEERDEPVGELPANAVQRCLEMKCGPGDYSAALILGRALCGFSKNRLPYSAVVRATNYRRGAAMLLRAADSGRDAAWSYLYRVHQGGAALGNPQMALYFLEKAAKGGDVVSQRKLGVAILRDATVPSQQEEGMMWLVSAARAGDRAAADIAATFVLPVQGTDAEAEAALVELRRSVPRLAARLAVARDFGLTKREALTVDLVSGIRTWGLVVGPHSFLQQRRLLGPRAIPAARTDVMKRLAAATDQHPDGTSTTRSSAEELRQRSDATRYALRKHGLDEHLFFARVDSTMLEVLKTGPKWAVRFADTISAAMGGD